MLNRLFTTLSGLLRKNAVVSLMGNGMSAVLGVSTLALLARLLPAEVLGAWILYQTSYTIFDMIRMGSLLNPFIQLVARVESDEDVRRLAGASWQLGIAFTAVVGLVLWGLIGLFPATQQWLGGSDTIFWFALTGVVAFPSVVATWWLHSNSRFVELQWLRLSNQIVFLLGLGICYFLNALTYGNLCIVFFAGNALVSTLALLLDWCRLSDVWKGRRAERQYLFDFGKYAALSFLGANLLRSADLFLIGAFMGPQSVALYSIPQRLLQILDMPIRSVVATSLPKLAEYYQRGQTVAFVNYFHREAGRLCYALLPLSLLCMVLAPYLVNALGGSRYEGGAIILQIFMVQGLLLPLDRYTSITLDSMGKPKATLVKIIGMLVVVVAGDLLVITLTGSLAAIALVSLLTFSLGLLSGYIFLNKYMPINPTDTLRIGWREVRLLVTQFRHA